MILSIRFSPEKKKLINPYTYLPFGIGPRACIGKGIALMEIKLCMIKILRRYRFVSCPETEVCIYVVEELNKFTNI